MRSVLTKRIIWLGVALGCWLPSVCPVIIAQAAEGSKSGAVISKPAPGFTLPDPGGKTHTLAEYQGRPVALFFFCGCKLCHNCAQAWGQMQRSGVLAQAAAGGEIAASQDGEKTGAAGVEAPLTVIVYTGNPADARSFARETGLDLKQTELLLDPEDKVANVYDAEPCPRVFVVDPQGVLRYTNNEAGDKSNKIPAPLIVARTVDAIRAIYNKTGNTNTKPASKSQH